VHTQPGVEFAEAARFAGSEASGGASRWSGREGLHGIARVMVHQAFGKHFSQGAFLPMPVPLSYS
jgi:hypothetical protein